MLTIQRAPDPSCCTDPKILCSNCKAKARRRSGKRRRRSTANQRPLDLPDNVFAPLEDVASPSDEPSDREIQIQYDERDEAPLDLPELDFSRRR